MASISRQIKNKLNDQLNAEDKQENRMKACFESLEEENIQICDPNTKKVVTHITETLKKDKSGKYDVKHCLEAFKEIKLVDCKTLQTGFTIKITSENCFDVLRHHNIEMCLKGSNMRCTKSIPWEKEVTNWYGGDTSEICKEEFSKHLLALYLVAYNVYVFVSLLNHVGLTQHG